MRNEEAGATGSTGLAGRSPGDSAKLRTRQVLSEATRNMPRMDFSFADTRPVNNSRDLV